MRRFMMAVAIAGSVWTSTLAGEVPTVGYAPPPPPPAAAPAAADGDMGGGGFAEQVTDEIVLAIFGFYAR